MSSVIIEPKLLRINLPIQTAISIKMQPPIFEFDRTPIPFSLTVPLSRLYEIQEGIPSQHDANLEGMPYSYGWSLNSRINLGNNPGEFTAAVGWGAVFYGENSPISTDRFQVKNQSFFVCVENAGVKQWWLLSHGEVEGAMFLSTFAGDSHTVPDYSNYTNGVATIGISRNHAFHFWAASHRKPIPAGTILGVLSLAEFRAVDESGGNAITPNVFVGGMAGDYWRDMTSSWAGTGVNNDDIAIGHFEYLTADWKWIGMATASQADLELLYTQGFQPVSGITL